MIILKFILVALFVYSWVSSKRGKSIEPSDFFVISFLIVYIPGFIFNPSGNSDYNQLHMSASVARSAEVGFSLALLFGSLIFQMRRYFDNVWSYTPQIEKAESGANVDLGISISAIVLSILIFTALLFTPDFFDYKKNILEFFSLKLSDVAYYFMRNYGFINSWIINSFLERMRYTLFPLLFVCALLPFLNKRRMWFAPVVGLAFYIALPASLSKLPIIIYIAYIAMLLLTKLPRLMQIGWIILISCVATGLLVESLSLLYIAQYAKNIVSGDIFPIDLAIHRIWGEPYSIVVRYFDAYPGLLPYTGWDGINLVARLIGHATRMPDLEVANAVLGPHSGSNPGVFFLAGYAAFGIPGLIWFTLVGFCGLWLIDIIWRHVRNPSISATYMAVMGVNVLFLNQIALQTALLTYGLGIIPIALFIMDFAIRRLTRED